MTNPQVLSDEQIEAAAHRTCSRYKHDTPPSYVEYVFQPHTLGEFARAIESATLEAVRGQAVAWAVEYGAVSLPHGDPSRITEWQVHTTLEAALLAVDAMDFDSRIYPITTPTQPPAQAEREWLPIETAPKDCAFLGYQRLTDSVWLVSPMYWAGSAFLILQYHTDNSEHEVQPTQWQPLPPPPAALKGQQ